MATVADFIETISAGTMPTSMQTVSLKQFRDAKEPDKAIYQALVSCRSKYSQIENFQFYKEDDVHITFHEEGTFGETRCTASSNCRQAIRSNDPDKASNPFSPKAAYRFNADIDFDNMRTIHTFPVDRGPMAFRRRPPGQRPHRAMAAALARPVLGPRTSMTDFVESFATQQLLPALDRRAGSQSWGFVDPDGARSASATTWIGLFQRPLPGPGALPLRPADGAAPIRPARQRRLISGRVASLTTSGQRAGSASGKQRLGPYAAHRGLSGLPGPALSPEQR